MGHQDNGNYASKHTDKKIDQTISKKIRELADNSCISCALAHQAGTSLLVSPSDIGVQIDLLEYRITECQLGLFGYGNEGKKIDPEIEIPPELNNLLDKENTDNRISCRTCWDIAKKLAVKRLDVGSACEKKKLRIKPCQLGAF